MLIILAPTTAMADEDCGVLAKLLNVCEIAARAGRDAGAKAAMEFSRGIDTATLNMREMTNQFGALVADLNNADPKYADRANRARSIFEGILGRAVSKSESPQLQLSVILVGPPNAKLALDTWVFSRDDNQAVRNLFKNDVSSFKGVSLNGSSIEPLTNDVVRGQVNTLVAAYEKHVANDRECEKLATFDENKNIACHQKQQTDRLVDAIMQLQGTPYARPTISRHVDLAPGGKVAILAPKRELEAILKASPGAAVHMWVHDFEKPAKPTVRFKDPETGKVEPIVVQLREFFGSDKCFDTTKPYGALCFVWVPLRLEQLGTVTQPS